MKPGDRLVCAFVDPVEVGETFKDWPLHVTIVSWFRTSIETAQLASDLKTVWGGIPAFEVLMGEGNVKFGHQKGKLATLVALPSPFSELNELLRKYLLSKNAWIADETTKVQREFRPHVTAQKSGNLKSDDSFRCNRLYIVEQKGGIKQVIGEIRL